jgi:hypothetical protein
MKIEMIRLLLPFATRSLAGLVASAALAHAALPELEPAVLAMMKTNTSSVVEVRIHFVEQWEISPLQKSLAYFSMFTNAVGDDQRKLAHAAVKYVASTNHTLVQRHLFNPDLSRTVLSVLMTDTLKRAPAVKLPALLQLARMDYHPLQSEARDLLRGYLGRDHGTNWVKWEEAMQSWLKTNPA